jgi:hypothetical protein
MDVLSCNQLAEVLTGQNEALGSLKVEAGNDLEMDLSWEESECHYCICWLAGRDLRFVVHPSDISSSLNGPLEKRWGNPNIQCIFLH